MRINNKLKTHINTKRIRWLWEFISILHEFEDLLFKKQ